MSIEERAEQYVGHPYDIDEDSCITSARDAYLQGAIDQQKIECDYWAEEVVNAHRIMVEKACKAFCKIECPHLVEHCWQDETDYPCWTFKQFKKAMEE